MKAICIQSNGNLPRFHKGIFYKVRMEENWKDPTRNRMRVYFDDNSFIRFKPFIFDLHFRILDQNNTVYQ